MNQVIKSEMSNGVVDKPYKEVPYSTRNAAHTGLQAVVGPFRMEAFERVLRIAGPRGADDPARWEGEVDPRFVLATAWDADRLKDSVNLLAQGREAPPVNICAIRFPELPTFYMVTDGMHRIVAARLAGKKGVSAVFAGGWVCDPSQMKIVNGVMMKRDGEDWEANRWGTKETFEVCDVAAGIGIKVQWSWWMYPYRAVVRKYFPHRYAKDKS